jgi:hypothetical protein
LLTLGAAALSRYFWPTTTGNKKKQAEQLEMRRMRGEKLRDIFKVTDDSPLCNRDLRNAWEHFDEKLDTYLISYLFRGRDGSCRTSLLMNP